MAEVRGKRAKKTAWQVSLGVKEVIFGILGLAGLMMMSFALGALAGRGDIFVMAHRWGLMGPEAVKVAQPPPLPVSPPQVAAIAPPGMEPAPAPGTPPAAAPAAKKPAPKPSLSQQKQKEEELRRLRQELARQMVFQNSLDTSRSGAKTKKGKSKDTAKTADGRASTTTVTVARFRSKAQAQAKLAELQKQGQKVALREGRDQKGVFYALVRQNAGREATPPSTAKARQPAPAGVPKKATP